jgi:hypothetical protein
MRLRIAARSSLSLLLAVGAVVFLANTIRVANARQETLVWPSALALSVAVGSTGVGLWIGSTAWLRILGEREAVHRADFFLAQLAKYLPGGVWQPLGQLGLSGSRNIRGRRIIASVGLHAGYQIAAGLLLLPMLVADPDLPPWMRVGSIVVAGLTAITLWKVNRIYEWLRRLASIEATQPIVPTTGAIERFRVVALLGVNLGLHGVAFLALAGWSVGPAAIAAYAAAWIAGFVAVPFPAGLGVREGVLIALLPLGSGQIVAASLIQRMIVAGTELSLGSLSRWLR